MQIVMVGLNYKSAPVEIREKFSFDGSELTDAMTQLKNSKSILENVIISTCNRTEIYAVVDQLHTGRYYIKHFLSEWFRLNKSDFTPYLTIYENESAVEHLFRVTCGLDSMILGETQILGQVRTSFLKAQQNDTIGTLFNYLFKQAVTVAKRAQSETDIASNAVSVSYAAVELAKKIFGDLKDKHVLILGAGKMGELAAENLHGSGAKKITVINRTYEKALTLAERFAGRAKQIEELQCALLDADILISSTGAKDYVITKDSMQHVEKMRKGRPIFMVDIAVPRDLDPAIGDLDSVFLYDIDDLQGIVEANLLERKKAAEQIEILIEEQIVAFNDWLNTLDIVPVIAALRNKGFSIQEETMQSIERKLPNLTERERKVLNKHTKSIINQLLRDPILYAKELSGEKHADKSLDAFVKIFGIEADVQQEIEVQKEKHKKTVAEFVLAEAQ
ncbi:glutamyl-tRNA reductase [Bacillus sp. HMF5848]|uniref:glutamyl-tRNA reductase n=1 Tax=Bacillus sp. HMF5848 TaxID=2495421 RepID=UPI000F7A747A|nr:glutamyl-tRNA reductase [Bacillus sp. HMF5848]RSK28045.1 glutamyl-tRNA reductase [Bacillus sp. HMF5848]